MLACERLEISQNSDRERNKNGSKNLPCAANPARHVGDIESKQAIGIGCITRDAHAVSAGASSNICAVDTYVDKVVVCVNVAIAGCCCLIDVVDIPMSRVGRLRQGMSTVNGSIR